MLTLGFDLMHLKAEDGKDSKEYTPQAPWLNKFLRLPSDRIDLEFTDWSWEDPHYGVMPPIIDLIEALNHVDG